MRDADVTCELRKKFKIYAQNAQGLPNGLKKGNKLKEFNRRLKQ